jgi:hypothetical protein
MNETTITLIGNLTADPELRFTNSGTAVANFTVATTPRTFDRSSGEWRDAEPLFLRCTLWRAPRSTWRSHCAAVTGSSWSAACANAATTPATATSAPSSNATPPKSGPP